MTESPPRSHDVVLVESGVEAARQIRTGLAADATSKRVWWVGDGVEALAFLKREGAYAKAPLPDLLLLDLHVTGMSGFEVLRRLKADSAHPRFPIVALSRPNDVSDVTLAYQLQASCVVSKPSGDELTETAERLAAFWLGVVTLPHHCGVRHVQ